MSMIQTPMFTGAANPTPDMGANQSPMDLGPPSISLAGWIVALLALKFFDEASISAEPASVRIDLLNIVKIGLMAGLGIIGIKLLAAWLLNKGIIIPGFNDLAGAL